MNRTLWTQLLQWKHKTQRKPLILKGTRQVGKTYLLKAFGASEFVQTHYINFEKSPEAHKAFQKSLNPADILQQLEFFLQKPIHPDKDLLIFDEIQECPSALTSLKYFCEESPSLHLVAAGSLLGLNLSHASFPVGKVDFLTLRPFSFSEFLLALDDERSYNFVLQYRYPQSIPEIIHDHLFKQWKYYLITGGLPDAILAFKEHFKTSLFTACDRVRTVQNSLITAYEADMAKHCGKINSLHLQRIWHNIPAQLAKMQEGTSSRFKFKGIIPNTSRYSQLAGSIDWLQAAGLIFKIPIINRAQSPLQAYSKENFFKLYVFDVGILGSLSNLAPQSILDYDYGSYKGYFGENFIAQELSSCGAIPLFAWQERNHEIEFLTDTDNQLTAIEVKSGTTTKAKSLHEFSKRYKPQRAILLSAKNVPQDSSFSVEHFPVYLANSLYRKPS